MRYLIFIVHPAKFHFLRSTINTLKELGHKVDLVIVSRDILEDLIKNEGWDYTNLFPEGRKIKHLHIYISASINLLRTIFRLYKLSIKNKYDLLITDDLLTFVGRFRNIKSIFITDDDIRAVPESFLLAASANYILAPKVCNMGRYTGKKIGYKGYKALAHFHPNKFEPNVDFLPEKIKAQKYFFIRVVSPTSTHDVGKRGIDDVFLKELVKFLSRHGEIVISNERPIPAELEKYKLNFSRQNVGHIISYSSIFISDSTTMCAEAAVLGVPSIEIDDWHKDFKQYEDFNRKYALIFGFYPSEKNEVFVKLDELLACGDELSNIFRHRRDKLLSENIDLSSFLIWLLSTFPNSINEYFADESIQNKYLIR